MRTLLTSLLLAVTLTVHAQDPPVMNPWERALPSTDSSPEGLVLYPNPTHGIVRVLWGTRSLVRMPLEVRTMDGRLLLLDVLSPEQELDVRGLEDGTYRLYLMDLSGVRAQAVFRVLH